MTPRSGRSWFWSGTGGGTSPRGGGRWGAGAPRAGAPCPPRAARELLEPSGADPWELVTGADAVLRHFAESQVPAAVRGALERAHRGAMEGLVGYAEISRQGGGARAPKGESARP